LNNRRALSAKRAGHTIFPEAMKDDCLLLGFSSINTSSSGRYGDVGIGFDHKSHIQTLLAAENTFLLFSRC
jgi:hypothetical protein